MISLSSKCCAWRLSKHNLCLLHVRLWRRISSHCADITCSVIILSRLDLVLDPGPHLSSAQCNSISSLPDMSLLVTRVTTTPRHTAGHKAWLCHKFCDSARTLFGPWASSPVATNYPKWQADIHGCPKSVCQRTEAVERCGTYLVLQLIGGLMCLGNIWVDDLVSYE